jgi:predicted  nucleic acid-binding Zn-ribbon protein
VLAYYVPLPSWLHVIAGERTEIASQASEAKSKAEHERGVAMRMLAQEQSAHEATRKELTSSFLSMKESLTERIVKLSSQIQELHDARDELDFGIQALKKNHVAALSKKDDDIAALKSKMDDSTSNCD